MTKKKIKQDKDIVLYWKYQEDLRTKEKILAELRVLNERIYKYEKNKTGNIGDAMPSS